MRALRLAAALSLAAFTAQADITSHGVSAFGELKYPADYPHFDYVNPDAPKGGAYTGRSTFAARTFDSLNPLCIPDLLCFPRCSVLQGAASGRHTP